MYQILRKFPASGELPHEWKVARIVSVLKSGRACLVNYGLIYLLLSAVRYWNILFHVISEFWGKYLLLSSSQHVFRKELSAVTRLIELTYDFSSILNVKGQVDIIFLDFRKAFDKVNHLKLILKLKRI